MSAFSSIKLVCNGTGFGVNGRLSIVKGSSLKTLVAANIFIYNVIICLFTLDCGYGITPGKEMLSLVSNSSIVYVSGCGEQSRRSL
jgi:hypothetical protein